MPETEKEMPQEERPKVVREFDEVFQHVNSFGRYQWMLFAGINIFIFPVSSQFSALVFAFGAPGFHCTTANVTCPAKKCCHECNSYEFDGPFQSTVSEWNLICDRAYLAATVQSCYFAGMLIGSFVTGMISDAWGRKKCIFLCNAIMLIFGVASAFAKSVAVLSVLRFIVGFGLSGVMLPIYIYCMELVGPSQRTAAGNIMYLFYGVCGVLFVLFTYLIRDWKMLLLVTTVPAILLFPFWRLIPESPRWLIAHNQLDEAQRVLMLYGCKKGKPLDPTVIRTLIEDVRNNQEKSQNQKVKMYTPLDLVRTPKLRKWTAILCYQWFVTAFVSFGIILFITQLAGDIYVNIAIIKSAAFLRVPATWFMFLKFGRRIPHGVLVTCVGITLLLVLTVYKDFPTATTVLSLLGHIFIGGNWTGVYLITSEIFPTVLRNTAQGTGSTSARIGGILAPYAAMMGQLPGLNIAFPVSIFGILAIIAGVSMYWLPETLYSPMHQTIEAAEAAEDDYGIPCCRKRPLRQELDLEEMAGNTDPLL